MRVIFISGYAEDTFRRTEGKVEDLHVLPRPFGLGTVRLQEDAVTGGATTEHLRVLIDAALNGGRAVVAAIQSAIVSEVT